MLDLNPFSLWLFLFEKKTDRGKIHNHILVPLSSAGKTTIKLVVAFTGFPFISFLYTSAMMIVSFKILFLQKALMFDYSFTLNPNQFNKMCNTNVDLPLFQLTKPDELIARFTGIVNS